MHFRALRIRVPSRVCFRESVSISPDIGYQFFGRIFFSYEEYSVSDQLDVKSERVTVLSDEAKQIAQGTAAGKDVDGRCVELGIRIEDCLHSGLSGV